MNIEQRMKELKIVGYHSMDKISEEEMHKHLDEIERMLNARKEAAKALK